MIKEDRIKYVLIFFGLLFLGGFSLFPVIYMVSISLCEDFTLFLSGEKLSFSLINYSSILKNKSLYFSYYLKNSLLISSISAFFSVLISSLASYFISRLNISKGVFILFLVLAVSMFPQISVVGYLFRFLSRLNLINTYYSLILPYISWNLPLSLWIITNYFNQIPKELDNAAKIDGSSNWKIFYKVILPLSLPGLFSAFLLSFIFSFNEFLFALIFTADYKARPLTVAVALFQGLHGEFLWGEVMAFSTLSIIPVFLLTILFQKYIISGLIKGAIKG